MYFFKINILNKNKNKKFKYKPLIGLVIFFVNKINIY
jgi:hypothetical protein